jgi:hypothetical protein
VAGCGDIGSIPTFIAAGGVAVRLTALLVEAVKEQQLLIERQSDQLTELRQRLTRLETSVAA